MNRKIDRRDFIKNSALAGAALSFSPLSFDSWARSSISKSSSADQQFRLWFDKPAVQWVEALPVGNGRLGAMVFGGVEKERLQLNEDTLYGGGPYDPNNPAALEALPEARRLIFDGKYKEAHDLIGEKMMAVPVKQMPYQPAGDLLLEFPDHTGFSGYRRELDLDTAITAVSYSVKGIKFTREVFSSPVDQVIAVNLAADKKGQLNFRTSMTTPQKAVIKTGTSSFIVMEGENGESSGIKGRLKFNVLVKIINQGGSTTNESESIIVSNADSVLILISIATSYVNYKDVSGDPALLTESVLRKTEGKSYSRIRADHIKEHRRLFRRVQIDVGNSEDASLPTDQRPLKFLEGKDPQLAALYYQYGRYLLISSSRPGTQPANLQGIWNEFMTPPWECKYTININTEMNYWPAEPANLSECHEPLLRMVTELVENGSRTAKVHYGAGGWVCHHNTDLWRAAAPIDGPLWGFWPTGGAWLSTHLWNHYEYTLDKEFLARVYPVMKGAAQFFTETLVEEPKNKWLVTCPSISPENKHPFDVAVCAGPSMDSQILYDLFSCCIKAAEILGEDKEFSSELQLIRSRLAPLQIGKAGQLREWLEDWDLEAPEREHRHVSHLYSLFPGNRINWKDSPEFFNAAKKTLEFRGDGGTGWSLAWKINFYARLLDGDHAYLLLRNALTPIYVENAGLRNGGGVYPNLFDAHPPFQIDGNFGAVSGITEMLMQSHLGEIHLLPALPSAWPAGRITGLKARGGFEVDIYWEDSKLRKVTLKNNFPGECRVRYGEKLASFQFNAFQELNLNGALQEI